MYFQFFVIFPRFKKGRGSSFEQTWIPKDALCQVCLNWHSGSGEEDENVKKLTDGQTDWQMDGQTDDRQPRKLSAHVS